MTISLEDMLDSPRTGRCVVMGILNVTPDSFSDGGRFLEPAAAVARAREMLAGGAEILDVGAESTRPGSRRVPADEQIARLREILPAVVAMGAQVSIDTTRAKVAAFALDAGAAIVNDISAGRDDPELFPLVAERACPLVLMHMLGDPATMQSAPRYDDVVAEVKAFLSERLAAAVACGVPEGKVILDPGIGIGFGKTLEHNVALLAGLGELAALGRPVLVGPSRKRFLGELTGRTDPAQRVSATVAACLEARRRGATIFRVHDVVALTDALAVAQAVEQADPGKKTSL